MKSNLVLLGYRGTGKSTVAALLAARTGWPVISLDRAIVERAGLAVPEIVARFGWPGFRERERAEVLAVCRLTHRILDCGGGVVEDGQNVAALKDAGFCVLLTAEVATIAARIGGDTNRPSLTGRSLVEEIEQKLVERGPLYRAAADAVVATDTATPEETAAEILRLVPMSSEPRSAKQLS